MKQVFFSAASVLLLILIASAIAFNPFTASAQIEHVMPPGISITQPINPAITTQERLEAALEDKGEAINPDKSFEELHKDKAIIFELDETAIKVNRDFSYQSRTKKRIKILNESVIEAVGELSIPYNSSRAAITSLRAHTIAPDGKIYPAASIQDLSRYELAMYSDMRVKVVTFSNVTVGSRLEYEVVVDLKRGPVKDTYFEDFYFRFSSPTKEENVSFTFPKELGIAYKEFNLSFKPRITEDNENITYSWHFEDMYEEPLREGMLPYASDELIRDTIEFSSIKSWDDVSSWYYKLVEKNLIISPEIASVADALTKGLSTTRERTKAILEYIQKDFRYVSMSFGDNGLEPHKTTEAFYNKYGDCKDLSLLCMGLLKAAEIDSSIVLFNTEGSITDPSKDLAFPTLFDHVILLVKDPKDGDFFIDPLLEGYDINEFPVSFQRAYAFVIGKDKGEFKRFGEFPKERCYKDRTLIIDIEPDGSSTYQSHSQWDLDFSISMRDKYKSMTDEEKEHMYKYLETTIADGGNVIDMRIDGLDKAYGPLNSYSKVFNKDEYPIIDDMIIIDLSSYGRDDEFTKETRQYPIFNAVNSLERATITYNIPKGFKVTYIPEDLSLDNGIFSFKRTFRKKKGSIMVEEIEQTRRIELPKERYQELREFNDTIAKKTTQRIVLTRKKSFWKALLSS